jgi:hypothetical protein
MATATTTRPAPIYESYRSMRYGDNNLHYFVDASGRHVVSLDGPDGWVDREILGRFATVEEARGAWRAARKRLIAEGFERLTK